MSHASITRVRATYVSQHCGGRASKNSVETMSMQRWEKMGRRPIDYEEHAGDQLNVEKTQTWKWQRGK